MANKPKANGTKPVVLAVKPAWFKDDAWQDLSSEEKLEVHAAVLTDETQAKIDYEACVIGDDSDNGDGDDKSDGKSQGNYDPTSVTDRVRNMSSKLSDNVVGSICEGVEHEHQAKTKTFESVLYILASWSSEDVSLCPWPQSMTSDQAKDSKAKEKHISDNNADLYFTLRDGEKVRNYVTDDLFYSTPKGRKIWDDAQAADLLDKQATKTEAERDKIRNARRVQSQAIKRWRKAIKLVHKWYELREYAGIKDGDGANAILDYTVRPEIRHRKDDATGKITVDVAKPVRVYGRLNTDWSNTEALFGGEDLLRLDFKRANADPQKDRVLALEAATKKLKGTDDKSKTGKEKTTFTQSQVLVAFDAVTRHLDVPSQTKSLQALLEVPASVLNAKTFQEHANDANIMAVTALANHIQTLANSCRTRYSQIEAHLAAIEEADKKAKQSALAQAEGTKANVA